MDATRSKTDASQGHLSSIMNWAQTEGKRTGIITTTRITHATPAATYANVYHRDWECDSKVPAESKNAYADIARQLVEKSPGNRLNVIMGGGLSPMGAFNAAEISTVNFEGNTESVCQREDKRNLVQEWLNIKEPLLVNSSHSNRVFVSNRKELLNVNTKEVDYLMGLFRNNHITYSIAREQGEPSLKEMVQTALGVLDKKDAHVSFRKCMLLAYLFYCLKLFLGFCFDGGGWTH